MALALYRKYRPRTFAEIIGQEHVTEPLSHALRTGRLNHAYLFSGPRGCGKTSSARIMARSLNCEQGPTPEPCGVCESCRSLANDGGGSLDVIEIDAASHGGVDDARELRERAFFAPVSSRFKVYVIDEAHMITTQGFNALLKLVEEPPEYVKFIFATTEPEKVLGTIKSRTHHYPFRLIPPAVLRPYLAQLTEAEGVTVEPSVFPLVVRAGGGSARDTLSVLDQLIAGAGPEGVSYARAVALLGVTDGALIDEMCDALAAGDGAAAYATVNRVADAGHDPRRFASDLLERLRDLIVLQQVPDAAGKGLIDAPTDQLERMAAQAQRLGPATLSRCADIVHNGLVEMRGTTAPRLLLELVCARMLLPGAEDSTGALLQRLERMERRLTLPGGELPPAAAPTPAPTGPAPTTPAPTATSAQPATPAPSAPAPQTAPSSRPEPAHQPHPPAAVMPDPVTPDPVRPTAAPADALDVNAIRQSWQEIVARVNRVKKPAAALIRDAVVREFDGEVLVLTAKSAVLANMMSNHTAVLADALYEEFGGRWQIRCEAAGDQRGGGSAGVRPAQPSRPAAREAAPPPRPVASTAADPADTGWPEPARPGGSSTAAPASGNSGSADTGWPEPVLPGGAARPAPAAAPAGPPAGGPASGAASTPVDRSNGGTSAPAAVRGAATAVAPATRSPASPVSAGRAAARAAAAGAGGRTPAQNGRGAVAAPAADADWAGEPPYDPEYDGPAGTGAGRAAGGAAGAAPAVPAVPEYEGFDPGDEPGDEIIDERTARQSSEQQAIELLRTALGAEKIGETQL